MQIKITFNNGNMLVFFVSSWFHQRIQIIHHAIMVWNNSTMLFD